MRKVDRKLKDCLFVRMYFGFELVKEFLVFEIFGVWCRLVCYVSYIFDRYIILVINLNLICVDRKFRINFKI